MKTVSIICFLHFGILGLLFAQDCTFFPKTDYQGVSIELSIGEYDTITLGANESPSWKIQNNNAAIQIKTIDNLPDNYPYLFINSADDSRGIGGGDAENFAFRHLTISCLEEDDIPQPEMFIPIDAIETPHYSAISSMPEDGTEVLVLRKAFIWSNSEDMGCCHGPWGAVSIRTMDIDYFQPYNRASAGEPYDFDLPSISDDYCEEDPKNCINCCSFKNSIYGFRLPGPVYTSDNRCDNGLVNQFRCAGLIDFFIEPFGGDLNENPGSEWIDSPYGVCYSNFRIHTWTTNSEDTIAIVLREGDVTNTDDFMGIGVVSKNDDFPKLIRMWYFGWILVDKITVPPSRMEPSIDIADYYWYNDYSGQYPDDTGVINPIMEDYFPLFPPESEIYDQYFPMPQKTIVEMESIFNEGSTIGLLGGKFPKGTLSKPMIYVAPCETATFDEN